VLTGTKELVSRGSAKWQPMEHVIEIKPLEDHRCFSYEAKCACGWTTYGVSLEQVDQHIASHKVDIPKLQWLERQSAMKDHPGTEVKNGE